MRHIPALFPIVFSTIAILSFCHPHSKSTSTQHYSAFKVYALSNTHIQFIESAGYLEDQILQLFMQNIIESSKGMTKYTSLLSKLVID